MFIFTTKIKRSKVTLGLLGAAVICAAAVLFTGLLSGRSAAVSTSLPNPKGIRTAEDRVSYLEGCGWLVDPQPIAVEELLIPKQFDETYQEYLKLQSDQGFDLTKYCGKRVKRYAYEIKNYPSGETGVQAGLLIYKNKVIGGEVLSPQLNGFIHGLILPEQ